MFKSICPYYNDNKEVDGFSKKNNIYSLQLGLLLLGQQVRHQQVAHLKSGFVEVETHALRAESLGNNVELETKQIKLAC